MRVAYGFDDVRRNEDLIDNAESLILGFAEAADPGRFLVNFVPFLKHVPSWFPGAGFQRFLGNLARISDKTLYPPFEEAKQDFVSSVSVLNPMKSISWHSPGKWKTWQTP